MSWEPRGSASGTGGEKVVGSSPSGVADDGSAPVKIGGVYSTPPSSLVSKQRGDLQLDQYGNLQVRIASGLSTVVVGPPNPLGNPTYSGLLVVTQGQLYNGATWDLERTPFIFKPLNAVGIAAETTIWTPSPSQKFRLMGFCFSQGVVSGAVILRDNTAGTTILIVPPNTVGTAIISPRMGNGIVSVAANNVLTAQGVATETLTGFVFGTEEL